MTPSASDVAAIERLLALRATTAAQRKRAREVIRAQVALQRLVSERAWLAYLRVEEASNVRDFERVDAIIVIAFRLAWKRTRDSTIRRLGVRALRAIVETSSTRRSRGKNRPPP